jgi:hypothetical protein
MFSDLSKLGHENNLNILMIPKEATTMKKLLVVGVFLFLCTVPLSLFAAQNKAVDKGSISLDIGTVLGLTFYAGDEDEIDFAFGTDVDAHGFGPTLNVSYFIIDNFSIGGTLSFASLNPEGAAVKNVFKFMPEANFYIPIKKKSLVDLKGFIGYTSSKSAGVDAISQLSLGGGAAYVYLLTQNLGIYGGTDLSLGLDAKQGGTNVGQSYFGFGIIAGLKVFL